MTHSLTRATRGHVAELVFAHGASNHATVGLLADIGAALADIDADPAIRATVLASDGKPFCGGADLATPGGFGTDAADPIRAFYDAALTIFAARKPVIAAVQGAAVGAGLGLALACDFRVAAADAKFAANFTRLGFHPGFGLTVTLPRLIGPQRALEMLMTSARYRADAVIDWGLVDRIALPGQTREAAHELAAEIADNAPLATIATRATLRAGLLENVRAAMAHEHAEQATLRTTADYAEGVASVFERREARFTGR